MTLFDPPGDDAPSATDDPAPASDDPARGSDDRGPTRMVRMVVAYDGTDFRGFATNAGVRTVGGTIAEAIERVTHAPADLSCAGRTDAGVHAWGQVVGCAVPTDVDPERLGRSLTGMLGPEIVVRSCTWAPPGWDARHAARWRRYRYTIVNRPEPDPFRARFAWWIATPLDLRRLHHAADPFIGSHDFAAFCRRGPAGSTTERRVLESHWIDVGARTGAEADAGVLVYEIRARAFCWQMVRAIVGTLVEVGIGKRTAGEMLAVLRSRDRAAAGQLAPPHGLCLWDVGYDAPAEPPVRSRRTGR